MINEIFGIVRKYTHDVIAKNPDIPDKKKDLAMDTTTNAINDGIKKYLNPSNITDFAETLSDNRSTGHNIILSTLHEDVINSLSYKVGLNSDVSSGIASALISIIMKDIAGKMNDPENNKFSMEKLIKTFARGDHKEGYLLDSSGDLF